MAVNVLLATKVLHDRLDRLVLRTGTMVNSVFGWSQPDSNSARARRDPREATTGPWSTPRLRLHQRGFEFPLDLLHFLLRSGGLARPAGSPAPR